MHAGTALVHLLEFHLVKIFVVFTWENLHDSPYDLFIELSVHCTRRKTMLAVSAIYHE